MPANGDTEITLGMGKMMGLFVGLVIVCGLFFGLGFSFGKNAAASEKQEGSLIAESLPPVVPANSAGKPAAGKAEQAPPEQTVGATAQTQEGSVNASPAEAAPEMAASANGTFTVQIAAVTKQGDAEALVAALKPKYKVFIANKEASDALYRVQVGPFANIEDAEAIRKRLQDDGYNPILKK